MAVRVGASRRRREGSGERCGPFHPFLGRSRSRTGHVTLAVEINPVRPRACTGNLGTNKGRLRQEGMS